MAVCPVCQQNKIKTKRVPASWLGDKQTVLVEHMAWGVECEGAGQIPQAFEKSDFHLDDSKLWHDANFYRGSPNWCNYP